MEPFRKLTACLMMLLVCQTQVFGWGFVFTGGPVKDSPNTVLDKMSAVEEKIVSSEAVKHTMHLLEQVAQLYSIYDNAMDTYESIGNAVSSVQRMVGDFEGTISSWTDMGGNFSLANAGRQIDRWGVNASDEGTLAKINQTLFGPGSAGGTIEDAANDIRRIARTTPRSFSRDRFIRNVFDGEDTPKINGATVVVAGDADQPLDIKMEKEMSSGTVLLEPTKSDEADFMVAVADQSQAQASLQQLRLMEDRRMEADMTNELIQGYGSSDLDNTALLRDRTLLHAQKMRMMNNAMETEAVTAESEMTVDAAYMTIYEAELQYKKQTAITKAALND